MSRRWERDTATVPSPGLRTLALFSVIALGVSSPLHAQFVSDPEKTDSLRLRNGDWLVGDLHDMSRGLVTYKTDAMWWVRVKWSRVLTAITEKSGLTRTSKRFSRMKSIWMRLAI